MKKLLTLIFCGPPGPNGSGLVSGGVRRFSELYESSRRLGYKTRMVAGVKDLSRALIGPGLEGAVVVVFDERYLFYAWLLKARGARIAFCPRGNKVSHFSWSYSRFRLRIYKILFSVLYIPCDFAIFQTSAQAKEFERMYKTSWNYAVVPNNSNASWIRPGAKWDRKKGVKAEFRVGFIGNASPRKGLFLLLDAVERLWAKGASIELVLGGVRGIAIKGRKVRCLGFISDLDDFYNVVDLVVVPSLYDSFPNVMLEAGRWDVPFIVARTEMTEEICGRESGLLFEPSDKALSLKISRIMQDVSEYHALESQSKRLVDRLEFDWGAEMIEAMVRGLLEHRRAK
ncbi:glycosyltransferase family 4 protein [Thioalkalivibrio sp. ALgr1]|uniref:glycosyltransferase family 4 protein n=1 Tax=Thioalkalivibrio sp. ALgr1 TaxID=748655 RepID=UPI0009FBC9D1|nr:glycosyltransferase family 4 protein [Thioalkalivibrio sp. ALgr1]